MSYSWGRGIAAKRHRELMQLFTGSLIAALDKSRGAKYRKVDECVREESTDRQDRETGRQAGEGAGGERGGGRVEYRETKPQYQEEIVRATIIRRFNVDIGQCCQCGRHVQGRHALQTSAALGAANAQLGPEALTLSAHLYRSSTVSRTTPRNENCPQHRGILPHAHDRLTVFFSRVVRTFHQFKSV